MGFRSPGPTAAFIAASRIERERGEFCSLPVANTGRWFVVAGDE
jgi:hypothetical protein